MKHLNMLGLVALSAMAVMSVAVAGTASATTLEVSGVTQNESITFTLSLKGGASLATESGGFTLETCTGSHVGGKTTAFTTKGTETVTDHPTGPIEVLSFSGCQHTVTVHNRGQLYFEHIAGTTNGRVYWENAEITTFSALYGTHINCKTGTGTLIGTLTGVKEGDATLDVNFTPKCSEHFGSTKWTGTYTVTIPTGLGVSS